MTKINVTKDGEIKENNIDVGLWKNMIFYKSIAHISQQRKKHDPKEKLTNHYANVPSKIGAYIKRPIEGRKGSQDDKSKSRSKSKEEKHQPVTPTRVAAKTARPGLR